MHEGATLMKRVDHEPVVRAEREMNGDDAEEI